MNLDRADLSRHLGSIQGADRSYVPEFLALLNLPGDVTSFDHFVPGHVTASGFVTSPTLDSVALIHHRKLQRWLQPGGHLEPGDADLEAAARREVAEETGLLDLSCLGLFDIDIHTFPARPGTPEHLHYDLRFAFRSETEQLSALDGVTDARWVPFGDLDEYGVDGSVARPVAKLVGLLSSGG